MDLDLDGKIAVVTGASKGIGLAVAEALTAEGVVVVAGARSPGTDLPALAERHENGSPGGTRGGWYSFPSISGPEGPIALVEAASRLGGVDILVNNAGAVTPRPVGFHRTRRSPRRAAPRRCRRPTAAGR